MPTSICDFCSDRDVRWRYPAETFIAYEVAGIVGESVGDWAACNICHDLIEADDRAGLLQRSLGRLLDTNPEIRLAEAELRDQLAGLHSLFFSHQTGDALRVV